MTKSADLGWGEKKKIFRTIIVTGGSAKVVWEDLFYVKITVLLMPSRVWHKYNSGNWIIRYDTFN